MCKDQSDGDQNIGSITRKAAFEIKLLCELTDLLIILQKCIPLNNPNTKGEFESQSGHDEFHSEHLWQALCVPPPALI